MFDNMHTELPVSSAAAIAAGVCKSAKLQAGENQLRTARSDRDDIQKQIREYIQHQRAIGHSTGVADRQLTALEQRRLATEATIRRLHGEVRAMRAERADLVVEALTPMRTAAAKEAVEALVKYKAAVGSLLEIADQVLRAGGEQAPFFLRDLVDGETEARLRRWAGLR